MTAAQACRRARRRPQGYCMMFALNNNGVPSVAKWIYLQ
jgi:hypothetical protein